MIDRRTLLGSTLALAAVPLLGACSGTTTSPGGDAPTSQGPVDLRLPSMKAGFPSPFSYAGGVGYIQASYVYDTLLWKDGSGAYVDWLTTSHDRSEDGRTLTFELRDDVTFSDGEPLTAEDVAFTFDYLREHADQIAPNVISVPDFTNLESVTAEGEHTAVVKLKQPDWTFEQFTGAGGIFIMPKHIWESISDPGEQTDPTLLIGTGPFRLDELDVAAGSYLYTAREDHFLGKPVVNRIEFAKAGKPLEALLAGQVDQAGGVGPGTGLRPKALEPFRNDKDFRIIESPAGHTVTALYWNLDKGGALADPVFRKACAHAIDRQQMVTTLFGDSGEPGNPGLIPAQNRWHTDVEQYAPDVAAAETMLDEAGYTKGPDGIRVKDGQKLSFELLTSSAQQQPPVDLVVEALKAIGVELKPASVDLPTFGERRMSGATEMSINTFGGTNTDEQPDGMGKVYASTARSLQRALGYRNDEFDKLWMQQRRTLDEGEREKIAHRMQQIVAEDLPVLPLFHPPLTTIVRSTTFDGWFDTPGGVGGLVPGAGNKLALITGGPEMP